MCEGMCEGVCEGVCVTTNLTVCDLVWVCV